MYGINKYIVNMALVSCKQIGFTSTMQFPCHPLNEYIDSYYHWVNKALLIPA